MVYENASGRVHEVVLKLLKNEKKGRLLDIGCGRGNLSKKFSEMGFEVYACDRSDFHIDTRIDYKKVNLNQRLPYPNGFFKYVVGIEVIEHLKSTWFFIEELSRILQNNGVFLITTPNIQHIQFRLYYLIKGIIGSFKPDDFGIIGHINPIYLPLLKFILKKNSMIIDNITYNRGWLYFGINKNIKKGMQFKKFHEIEYGMEIPFKNKYFGQIVMIKGKKV